MSEVQNWSFDLTQYDTVWKVLVNIGLLLIFLLLGNMIRRSIPFLRKGNVPSALIGGLLLLLVNLAFNAGGIELVDKRIMQVVTYHSLAIGFAAMSLKYVKKAKKHSALAPIQNGAITGGTYMLQAVLGMLVSLIFY